MKILYIKEKYIERLMFVLVEFMVVFENSTGCETPEFIVPHTSLQLHGIGVLQNP